MPENTVTVSISGRVDPSLTSSVDKAKQQMSALQATKPIAAPKLDLTALDRQIASIQSKLNTLQFSALKNGITPADLKQFETLRRELARLEAVRITIPVNTDNARVNIALLKADIDKLQAKLQAGTITIGAVSYTHLTLPTN